MRNYRRSLELATALIDDLDGEDHRVAVAAHLNECFRGTVTLFFDDSRIAMVVPDEVAALPWDEFHRECDSMHPLEHVYAQGRPVIPITVSDVVTDLAWRANPCYRSAHRELDGSIRQLGIPAPGPHSDATGFLVCRSGRDFTQREREFAGQMQHLVNSIFRHATELRRLKSELLASTGQHTAAKPTDLGLTPRELVVLRLAAEGLTAAAMARRLGITTHTVNKHLENSYRKCRTRDRLTTVLLLRDLGLAPPPRL